jgi:signal peptidase I
MHRKRIISIRTALTLLAVAMPIGIVIAALLALSNSYKIYVIHTGSMTPTIPSRSAVLVHKGDYHVGQVVSFHTAAGIVTHRVVKRNLDGSLTTKGDGNKDNDVNVVKPANVIGGVVAAPRELGYWIVYLENPLGLGSAIGTVVCVGVIWSIAMSLDTSESSVALPGRRRRRPQHLRAHSVGGAGVGGAGVGGAGVGAAGFEPATARV